MRVLLSVSVAVAITAAVTVQGQTIVNGGFNTTDTGAAANASPGTQGNNASFFGWTSSGNAPGNVVFPAPGSPLYSGTSSSWSIQYNPSGPAAAGGSSPYYAQLNPSESGGFGDLDQLITGLTSGDQYKISFYLAENGLGFSTADFTASFGMNDSGTTQLDSTDTPDGGGGDFQAYSITGTATGGSTALDFGFKDTGGDWFLTDVSITEVSAASGVPDSGIGFGLVAAVLLGLCGISEITRPNPRFALITLRK